MMLAQTWSGQYVRDWWISEKYDGVRGFWDGRALRTRSWREVAAPDWFLRQLPAGIALDGELWAGRGEFQIMSELARFAREGDAAWRRVRFMVFDRPTTEAVNWEERRARLEGLGSEAVKLVEHRRCEGPEHARAAASEIIRGGGEGIMLRRPEHFYVFSRSAAWLKVKNSTLTTAPR